METNKSSDYEAVLADLEAQRAELDSAIAVIKKQLGKPADQDGRVSVPSSKSGAVSHPNIATDAFFGMGVAEAAKKYLGMVRKSQTVQEICVALEAGGFPHTSKSFYATVFTALKRRFEDQGDIVRVKRGVWGLAEWYPGFKKGKKQEETKADQQPAKS